MVHGLYIRQTYPPFSPGRDLGAQDPGLWETLQLAYINKCVQYWMAVHKNITQKLRYTKKNNTIAV